ncbi:hypothetical protein [Sphingomonas sp.]|uniref:hypothetical protein n=1 Tax=Sphingomonas sp. TaxID=28214 RepID=UPI003B3A85FD
MRFTRLAIAAGALGLVLSPVPVLAQADETVAGGLFSARTLTAILPFLGAGVAIGAVAIAVSGDNNDSNVTPVSP